MIFDPTIAASARCCPRSLPIRPVLATTATTNARVVGDVAEQLGEGTLTLRGTLDRESLHLAVLEFADAAHRLAWLAEHLPGLPGSGIVYTLTVAARGRGRRIPGGPRHPRVAPIPGQLRRPPSDALPKTTCWRTASRRS